MSTRPKNLDPSQLAKRIVEEAAGEEPITPAPPAKNARSSETGAMGGKQGGARRAAKLTAEQRQAIAKKAAAARWKT